MVAYPGILVPTRIFSLQYDFENYCHFDCLKFNSSYTTADLIFIYPPDSTVIKKLWWSILTCHKSFQKHRKIDQRVKNPTDNVLFLNIHMYWKLSILFFYSNQSWFQIWLVFSRIWKIRCAPQNPNLLKIAPLWII